MSFCRAVYHVLVAQMRPHQDKTPSSQSTFHGLSQLSTLGRQGTLYSSVALLHPMVQNAELICIRVIKKKYIYMYISSWKFSIFLVGVLNCRNLF